MTCVLDCQRTYSSLEPKTGGREKNGNAFCTQSGEGSVCQRVLGRVPGSGTLKPLARVGWGRYGLMLVTC